MKQVIPLAGMVATLLLAYGLDRWVEVIRQRAAETFSVVSAFWGMAAANLLQAIALVGLAWLVFSHRTRGAVTGVVCLAVGLVITVYPALAVSVHFGEFYIPILDIFLPGAYIMQSAAYIAALGAVGLLMGTGEPS